MKQNFNSWYRYVERSNSDFAAMIAAKILTHPNCKTTSLVAEFGIKGDTNYACWCGAGTVNAKMFKPQNVLDRICRAHDICYDKAHDEGCPEPYDENYYWDYNILKTKVYYDELIIIFQNHDVNNVQNCSFIIFKVS